MISVDYFLLIFAHVSYLPTSTKGGLGFFILFFGFELLANIKKRPGFYTLTETFFINNSKSKQNKKNNEHPFVGTAHDQLLVGSYFYLLSQ